MPWTLTQPAHHSPPLIPAEIAAGLPAEAPPTAHLALALLVLLSAIVALDRRRRRSAAGTPLSPSSARLASCRFETLYSDRLVTRSSPGRPGRSAAASPARGGGRIGKKRGDGRRGASSSRAMQVDQSSRADGGRSLRRGRGGAARRGGGRGGRARQQPPTRERLDTDLEKYMLRDRTTGTSVLDADLDAYMLGAGGRVVSSSAASIAH